MTGRALAQRARRGALRACTRCTSSRWPGSRSARTCSAGLFWLLALAGLRALRAPRPARRRYLAVFGAFALGPAGQADARDAAVRCCCCSTVWPLGRLGVARPTGRVARAPLVLEKLPLLRARRRLQRRDAARAGAGGGDRARVADFPLGQRAGATPLVSLRPLPRRRRSGRAGLAVFYPHPGATWPRRPRFCGAAVCCSRRSRWLALRAAPRAPGSPSAGSGTSARSCR